MLSHLIGDASGFSAGGPGKGMHNRSNGATRSRSGGSATYKLAVSDTTGASPTVSDFSITHSGYAGQGDGSLIVAGPATVHIKTTSVGSSRPSDVNLSAFGYVTLA